MRWKALALAVSTICAAPAAHAQISDGVIKLGVMNDQSGTYADLSGQGSVWAARKAVEDFCKTTKCEKIEVRKPIVLLSPIVTHSGCSSSR